MPNKKSLADLLRKAGVTPIDTRTPADIENERQAEAMAIPPAAVPLIAELVGMPENDPHRGTENEGAFLDEQTRPRTVEIGKALHAIGGHVLLLRAYEEVRAGGGFSARSLEIAWHGIGDWRK